MPLVGKQQAGIMLRELKELPSNAGTAQSLVSGELPRVTVEDQNGAIIDTCRGFLLKLQKERHVNKNDHLD